MKLNKKNKEKKVKKIIATLVRNPHEREINLMYNFSTYMMLENCYTSKEFQELDFIYMFILLQSH